MTMTEPTPATLELELKREQKHTTEAKRLEELDKLIPKPVGYAVMVAIPEPEDTFESGLAKADETKHYEHILSSMGLVVDMGKQAYKGSGVKYSEGPWCEVGDYVMFHPNSGTRFRLAGTEYRLLNDDSIEAVVPNPKVISSAR